MNIFRTNALTTKKIEQMFYFKSCHKKCSRTKKMVRRRWLEQSFGIGVGQIWHFDQTLSAQMPLDQKYRSHISVHLDVQNQKREREREKYIF